MEFVEVRENISFVGADAAVVDPPWYDDIALPLVTETLRGLREGGGLLVGIPDRLTGCGSAQMLSSIAAEAKPFGMDCTKLVPGKFRYETPFFELNTLQNLGLRSVHPQWRTGRVAFGRKTRDSIPKYGFPADEGWREISVNGWRVRLRRAGNVEKRTVSGTIPIDVRKSVSRQSARGKVEECWTVGNRVAYAPVFNCPSAAAIHQIAEVEHSEVRRLIGDSEGPEIVTDKQNVLLTAIWHAIYSTQYVRQP
jgi:hypothetical protein